MATPLLVMFVLLVVLLAIGVQIGVALSLAAMAAVVIGDVPMAIFSGIFYSTFESVPLLAIPFFVIAGEIMSQGTLARVLLQFSRTLVGHMHGGLAHISVMTSLFYGALCGSAPATLAAVGGMVLPSMKEEGYPEPFSAALCAAGGALGPIIPPSIAVILFGSMSGASISDLFIAMIPGGILIAVAFMGVSYYYSRRYGYGRLAPRASWGERGRALWEAKWALLVPVIVLGGIYGGITTPTEAGGIAVVYSLFVECFITRNMTWELAGKIFMSSLRSTGMIFLIVIGALVLGQVLVYFQADAVIAGYITGITTNKYILMALFVLLFILLGCFMEVSSAILLMTPVLMPIVTAVGINPIHFGVVFVTTIVCGVITPPVGINLFMACAMTGTPFSAVCRAAGPFICAMLGVTVLIAFVPQVCLFLL